MQTKSKVVFFVIMVLAMIIVGCAYWQQQTNEATKQNEISEMQYNRTNVKNTAIEKLQEMPTISEIDVATTEIKDNKVEIETSKEVDTEFNEKHTEVLQEDVEDVIEETAAKYEPAFYLSDYERWIAECIVMGESGYESYEGQLLVSQCLLNACIKDGLQPSEVRTKYKYAGWHDNPTDGVKDAVSAVFDDGYKITDEFILYFYAPKYSKGKWHETQRFVIEVGGHRFFTEWDK